jgi:hypothetical protein
VIRRIHTANALGRPGSLVVREAYVSDGHNAMLARRSPSRLTRSRQRELALATVNPSDPGSPLSDWDGQSSSTSASRNLHGHARPQQERRRVRLSGRLASKTSRNRADPAELRMQVRDG